MRIRLLMCGAVLYCGCHSAQTVGLNAQPMQRKNQPVAATSPSPDILSNQGSENLVRRIWADPQFSQQEASRLIDDAMTVDPDRAAKRLSSRWLEAMIAVKWHELAAQLALNAALKVPGDPVECFRLLRCRAQALTASGRHSQAIEAAKSAFNIATLSDTEAGLQLLSDTLIASEPSDPARANLFLAEEMSGLSDEKGGLSPSVLRTIKVEKLPYLNELTPDTHLDDYASLVKRGNLLLLADEPSVAMGVFQKALLVAPPPYAGQADESIARAMKARDGSIANANRWLREQTNAQSKTSLDSAVNQARLPTSKYWVARRGVITIPRVKVISIDGNLAKWEDQGLLITALAGEKGETKPNRHFKPELRLGWDERGLLAAVRVIDDTPIEYDYVRHLFKGDSIEFFVGTDVDSLNRYMVVISPGRDPKQPNPRHCFFNDPEVRDRPINYKIEYTRRLTSTGYEMEVLLPWSNLGAKPKVGREVAFQFYAIDATGSGDPFTACWFPTADTQVERSSCYRLVLCDQAQPPMTVAARAIVSDDEQTCRIAISAPQDAKERDAAVFDEGGQILGKTRLLAKDGLATASLNISRALVAGKTLEVQLPNQRPAMLTIRLHDIDREAQQAMQVRCIFHPAVFSGESFPNFEVRGVPGNYISSVAFYDAHYQPVQKASEPGRYGAVVTITRSNGRTTRRYASLFRLPDNDPQWSFATDKTLISEASRRSNTWVLDQLRRYKSEEQTIPPLQTIKAWQEDQRAVSILSSAYYCFRFSKEEFPGLGPRSEDRQWWVGFKRRSWGLSGAPSPEAQRPIHLSEKRYPVVRTGSLAEAGIDAAAVARVDRILREASLKYRDEPLSVCLVRHSVIFHHAGYGILNGHAMSVDDPGEIQSITKSFALALMITLVDADLVSPDAPAASYLKPLRDRQPPQNLTVSSLYSFTSGLRATHLVERNDLEEIVSDYAEHVNVGQYYYESAGYDLGGKIAEAVTGESLPRLYQTRLLQPLGLNHTTLTTSSTGARATCADLAVFGQLLLNRGGYGDLQFFSDKTYAGFTSDKRIWGHVTSLLLNGSALSDSAYYRDASNSGMLLIDPDNDLVLALVSVKDHKNFRNCYPGVIAEIINGLR